MAINIYKELFERAGQFTRDSVRLYHLKKWECKDISQNMLFNDV